MKAKFTSIMNHVKNVHEGHGEHFNTCQHGVLEPREWIAEGMLKFEFVNNFKSFIVRKNFIL